MKCRTVITQTVFSAQKFERQPQTVLHTPTRDDGEALVQQMKFLLFVLLLWKACSKELYKRVF